MSLYFAEITGDRSILDVEERLHKGQEGVELEETPMPQSSSVPRGVLS
jgi:hypothetical protein